MRLQRILDKYNLNIIVGENTEDVVLYNKDNMSDKVVLSCKFEDIRYAEILYRRLGYNDTYIYRALVEIENMIESINNLQNRSKDYNIGIEVIGNNIKITHNTVGHVILNVPIYSDYKEIENYLSNWLLRKVLYTDHISVEEAREVHTILQEVKRIVN